MKEKIIEIHNALCGIAVKGEDTITMAKCLLALRECVEELNNEEGLKDGNV